jgi:hypothetical protein
MEKRGSLISRQHFSLLGLLRFEGRFPRMLTGGTQRRWKTRMYRHESRGGYPPSSAADLQPLPCSLEDLTFGWLEALNAILKRGCPQEHRHCSHPEQVPCRMQTACDM